MSSATWSLTKMDVDAVSSALDRLLRASGAQSAMIVDRSGQLNAASRRDELANAQGRGLLRGAEREIDSLFS